MNMMYTELKHLYYLCIILQYIVSLGSTLNLYRPVLSSILIFSILLCPFSPVPAHSWLESGSNTPLSYYTPQPSPPLLLSTPNAHSSPRALPSSFDVGNLELSLLEAMEGLESLGLNGTQPPLLPQKRRGVDGGELSLNSPFSLSGGSNNNGSPTASSPSPG